MRNTYRIKDEGADASTKGDLASPAQTIDPLLTSRRPEAVHVRIDAHLQHHVGQWNSIISINVAQVLEAANINLHLRPEPPYCLQDFESVDEELNIRIEVRINNILN
jgi:hypothetical protein